ncbi:MAG: hypothetical protein JST32_10290 [Bacteroidetes bacterium]|nr:hypothetical protein [Bacteroidota bacterium]
MKKITFLSVLSLLILGSCSKKNPAPSNSGHVGGVTTYAGNGTAGLQNGAAASAEFNLPVDMVTDIYGNVYISEQGNNDIRVITAAGQVITLAGTGTKGYKDGDAASAQFNDPEGLVIDDLGNLYVADAGNNVIRMITPTGKVSTYAGNGTAGLHNGVAASAEFASPRGLTIDKQRNIYVADYSNNVIRKISSTGSVSTLAGSGAAGNANGAAGSASFSGPTGLAIDNANIIYVAEAANGDIRQVSQGGQVSTFAGSLPNPIRVSADAASGNVYVSCTNNTIMKVDASGKSSVFAGNQTPGSIDGTLTAAEFNAPMGLIAFPQGQVLVADYGNSKIRLITP